MTELVTGRARRSLILNLRMYLFNSIKTRIIVIEKLENFSDIF